jgi:hypothetical protein
MVVDVGIAELGAQEHDGVVEEHAAVGVGGRGELPDQVDEALLEPLLDLM